MKVLMHHSQRAARSFVRGLEIRLNAANSMDELQSVVNSELENLHKWLNTNKLSLDIAKTEFMIIGSRQRMSAMDDRITVEINDCEVEKVDSVKSLGVYIDKHLNWSTHIEKISKKIASAMDL